MSTTGGVGIARAPAGRRGNDTPAPVRLARSWQHFPVAARRFHLDALGALTKDQAFAGTQIGEISVNEFSP
jgi:hypothetical protein